jgi:acyl-CoA dehydrogenase
MAVSFVTKANSIVEAGEAPSREMDPRIAAAVAVARRHADTVDVEARFPREAFEELRAQKLLGLLLPVEAGGEATRVSDVAQICYALGRACSSTAMIYAMHQANVACIVQHADATAKFSGYLRRIGQEQMLVASSTTEGSNGANVRTSGSAINSNANGISLSRDSSVLSYGADADAIVSTARRAPESIGADQVLVLFFKEQYALTRSASWDALGMRGTCSEGFRLEAWGEAEQVLTTPYERIHRHAMMPVTHLLWAACWAGIAAGAVERAQGFVRKVSRLAKGALPPGAPSATQASLSLMTLVNMVGAALTDYEHRAASNSGLDEIAFQTSLNLLKVGASQLAIETVMHALNTAGISGYRNDSEFSIGRPLRDILSSSVMINNSRILANVAVASLLGGVPERI